MIDTCHFELHVRSLAAARSFYVDALGLEILQELPAIKLLAVKAGGVRLSIFEAYAVASRGEPGRAHIIFRTPNLESTIQTLRSRGVAIDAGVKEAPGFMRYVSLCDPSGNYFEIAEYLRDPLVATA